MVTDGVGRGVAEDDGRFGDAQSFAHGRLGNV